MKKKIGPVWILIILFFFVATGVYKLDDGEEAVITRFGEYLKTEKGGGLKYMIPIVDSRYVINTAEVKRMEFGYEGVKSQSSEGLNESSYEDITQDSLMITGDENLVNVSTSIQYRIVNAKDYIINVDDPTGTLEVVSVSTIRRSVANNSLDDVLADNKNAIMQEIREDLQKIADSYGLGIQITQVLLQNVNPPAEVDDAFKDIVRAQLDKESRINEAVSYENKIIPQAKGDAAKLVAEAESYKEKRINQARGDVANFEQVYREYKDNKAVSRTRLYLETMQSVLKDVDIVIAGSDGQTLKFLPLTGGNFLGEKAPSNANNEKN
ncbi:MAG: FtsH protease activity modulator HflK [Bacillota bacterium]|nr:FtsH protease activity modulator HflK [Bacillota bacterium]